MMCTNCETLFDSYKSAVGLYTVAVRKLVGAIGDDFMRVHADCERLRRLCNTARQAWQAHYATHSPPTDLCIDSPQPVR